MPESSPRHPNTACRRFCGFAVAGLLVLGEAGACARWDGEAVYHPSGKNRRLQTSFAVGLPGAQWQPLGERGDGLQVAWKHQKSPSVIQVRSQCNEHGDSSLEMFTEHLAIDFGVWELAPERDAKAGQAAQTHFRLVGRDALRSHIHAALDGVNVELEVVVVKKDGCLFDLSYVSTPKAFAGGLASFERVVNGFRFPLAKDSR